MTPQLCTRRRVIAYGIGGLTGAAVAGFELIEHNVLPGKHALDELAGGCSVSGPALTYAPPGQSRTGQFFSARRKRVVGFAIAYPPGHGPGSELPLAVSLHGFGGNHASGFGDVSLANALAARQAGRPLAPFALVSVDGGGLYWNPHPADDPLAMIVDELIPMCQRIGLGRPPHPVGTIGIRWAGTARYCSPRPTPG